jgi:N-acetylglucosaminyl-diphospho-decaprenol L-rhamnosyltransferase
VGQGDFYGMNYSLDQKTRLSIIIVAWNVRDLVIEAVASAHADLARSGMTGDIWIVDNASADDTTTALRKAFPEGCQPPVHILESGDNLGFAGGNNHALRAIGFPDNSNLPEFVLLLNPDTVVKPGALRALLEGVMASSAGLAGARLIYGEDSFQHSAFAFPGLMQLIIDLFPVPARLYESSLNGRYSRQLYAGTAPFEIDHPLGATFLLRREVIQQTGMFDEQFHLYCEEVDWAIRIKQAGWRAVCVPTAEVVHYGGQSTSQVRPQSIVNLWRARLQLYRKHYHTVKRSLAKIILRAGMNRLIQQTARDSSQDEDTRQALIKAYSQVIALTRQI